MSIYSTDPNDWVANDIPMDQAQGNISLKEKYDDIEGFFNDGWVPAAEAWAFASASTITVPAGALLKYNIGMKIKMTQTTDKFFYIIAVADTVLTVTGGSDFTVANAAITLPFFSLVENPFGFPQWFNVTAPTFDVTRYDDGAGGQPDTNENRMKISGNLCSVHYRGSGVKAAVSSDAITFNPNVYPTMINSTSETVMGYGSVLSAGVTRTIVNLNWSSVVDVLAILTTSVANNIVIEQFTFFLNFEI